MSDELPELVVDGGPAAATPPRSLLLWDNPEVRCSLGGDGMLGSMLPKLWLPVLSATGISLPPGVELRRVVASSAADAIVASGVIDLAAGGGEAAAGALAVVGP